MRATRWLSPRSGWRRTVGKLLQSALDNANFLASEKGLDVEIDNLYVKSAIANDGPRMKRIRPAPQGRAYRYQRRIAHIELILAERGKDSSVVHAAGGDTHSGAKIKRSAPAAKAAAKKSASGKSEEEGGGEVGNSRFLTRALRGFGMTEFAD